MESIRKSSRLLCLISLWAFFLYVTQSARHGPSSALVSALEDFEEDADLDTRLSAHQQSELDSQEVEEQAITGIRARRRDRRSSRKHRSPESRALDAWAHQLTEKDYNYSEWRIMFHSRSTVDFFNGYARRLSSVFKENEAKVNFAMIGACDGTGDNTIKHLYLPNDHWRGVFVEPMSINVRDLIKYMADKHANHRSFIIHAAATAECESPTLTVERPLYEEKNKSIPHWLRRQIGSVLPKNRDHARKEWTLEEVRCVTAENILAEWASGSKNISMNNNRAKAIEKPRKRRPHVLKIDVEGHDYEVLMSFLTLQTPAHELPLLVDFEAKSIAKKFPAAKERMEQLGYVVSPFGQDGFAILGTEKILESIDSDPRISNIRRARKRSFGSATAGARAASIEALASIADSMGVGDGSSTGETLQENYRPKKQKLLGRKKRGYRGVTESKDA